MLGSRKLWPCTGACTLPGEIQVWAAWLDAEGDGVNGFWSMLSNQERERANHFVFERDRSRFITARGILRGMLSLHLGMEPREIEFSYSAKGKPSLGGDCAGRGLEFNLAHSGNLAVFAVARRRMVGVDVEQVRPVPDISAIIERSFSTRESARIKRLSGDEAARDFFKIWTRKEAWLKATGEGITGALKAIQVIDPMGEGHTLAETAAGSGRTRLCLHDLSPAPGFLGALAVTAE
jgi:4'-phosphopantetheinyl transferase